MDWIKHTLVDLAVTVLIILAVTLDLEWARWGVLIYTPLMVFLKIVALLGSQSLGQLKPKGDGVPVWFYHALYATNVAFSAGFAFAGGGINAHQWWMIAGDWALIWVLSIATEVRMRRPVATK